MKRNVHAGNVLRFLLLPSLQRSMSVSFSFFVLRRARRILNVFLRSLSRSSFSSHCLSSFSLPLSFSSASPSTPSSSSSSSSSPTYRSRCRLHRRRRRRRSRHRAHDNLPPFENAREKRPRKSARKRRTFSPRCSAFESQQIAANRSEFAARRARRYLADAQHSRGD